MVRLPPPLRPLFPYLKPVYTAGTRAVSPVTVALSRRRGGGLPTGSVATTEQAADTSGGRWRPVHPEGTETRVPPPGPFPTVFTVVRTEAAPRTVVAELPGGRVLGPHRAVITGHGDLVHDLSYYFGTTRPREHPLFLHPYPPAPLEVEGRLGVLATRGDSNYYHFLMDVLPRLAVQAGAPDIEAPTRWYVPATTRFQRELLELVGVTEAHRIDSDTHPHVRAGTLVVPSPPSMTVVNPAWVVAHLRSVLLPEPIVRVPGRRVYVTRGPAGANNRNVVDEPAVIAALERRGFEPIDPGSMTVAEQIRAFAQASTIVATHGAALANLVFAGSGATVVELFPAGAVVPDYWKLASGVPGLRYRYQVGRGSDRVRGRSQMLVSDIDVDLAALGRLLDELDEPGTAGGGRS